MSIKYLICPDGQKIEKDSCLAPGGCRMPQRCATLAYLRMVAFERPYRGVTPSMAGNGPRLIFLRETTDYAINPQDRAFAALGVGVHGKLSIHAYTDNLLAEEPLQDAMTAGTPDCLEEDEFQPGAYVLTDYKTFGSFKVRKCLGIYKEDVIITDDDGKPIRYKSGQKKGEIKTRQEVRIDPDKADIRGEILQLNRYRMLFESEGFAISRMQLQVIVRDGGTKMAAMNGVENKVVLIPVPPMSDSAVLAYYDLLDTGIRDAFKTGTARICDNWESWDRRRCNGFCEVADACRKMEAA
jgi:hypothetical protein